LIALCALSSPPTAAAEELAVVGSNGARAAPARAASTSSPPPRGAAPDLAVATRALQTIEAQSFQVQAELRRARVTKDRHRAGCLTDLLTRLHVAARAGRGHRDVIVAAASRGDLQTVQRETVRLQHLQERATRLFSGASRCGDREVVIEATRSTVVRVISPPLPDTASYPRPGARPRSD
jgi:hypothetical protein